jgi:hypothetical protein
MIRLWLVLFLSTGLVWADSGDFDDRPPGDPGNGNSAYHPGIRLGMPSYGGTGCPQGSADIVLTEDKRTLSILFDSFIAESGGVGGPRQTTQSCSLLIPVQVPPGYRAMITRLDIRGFTAIPPSGRGIYIASYAMSDAVTGQVFTPPMHRKKTYAGPKESEFLLSSRFDRLGVWSQCGRSYVFRFDNRLMALSGPKNEPALAMIDSVDSGSGASVEYHLKWERCVGNGPPPPRPHPRPWR